MHASDRTQFKKGNHRWCLQRWCSVASDWSDKGVSPLSNLTLSELCLHRTTAARGNCSAVHPWMAHNRIALQMAPSISKLMVRNEGMGHNLLHKHTTDREIHTLFFYLRVKILFNAIRSRNNWPRWYQMLILSLLAIHAPHRCCPHRGMAAPFPGYGTVRDGVQSRQIAPRAGSRRGGTRPPHPFRRALWGAPYLNACPHGKTGGTDPLHAWTPVPPHAAVVPRPPLAPHPPPTDTHVAAPRTRAHFSCRSGGRRGLWCRSASWPSSGNSPSCRSPGSAATTAWPALPV